MIKALIYGVGTRQNKFTVAAEDFERINSLIIFTKPDKHVTYAICLVRMKNNII